MAPNATTVAQARTRPSPSNDGSAGSAVRAKHAAAAGPAARVTLTRNHFGASRATKKAVTVSAPTKATKANGAMRRPTASGGSAPTAHHVAK